MKKYDILLLFPVGFKEWIRSGDCRLSPADKRRLLKRDYNPKIVERLSAAYPSYQHWFMHEGCDLLKGKARAKYLFLICPLGNTAMPADIQRAMKKRGVRSVHELLVSYTFMMMMFQHVLSEDNYKTFVNLLLDHGAQSEMEFSDQ